MSTSLTPTTKINNTSKARYLLASASNRFFARIIDMIIVGAIIAGLTLILVHTDNYNWNALNLVHSWRYFAIGFLTTIIAFLYFIFCPFCFNGQTICQKIFKLQTFNLIPTKNFLLCLMRREICVWMITASINFFLGVVLWSIGPANASKLLNNLLLGNNDLGTINAISIVFQTSYAIAFMILLFVIIHMFINNKKRCFIDHISDTCVIKTIDVNSSDANTSANRVHNKAKRNYGLPGEITSGMSDEIDSL